MVVNDVYSIYSSIEDDQEIAIVDYRRSQRVEFNWIESNRIAFKMAFVIIRMCIKYSWWSIDSCE